MKCTSSTALALAIVTSCITHQVVAQGTPAQMLPGGEWALGRWEGNLVTIGTSSGTAGLRQSPRTLIVQKNADGTITCLWFISNDPKSAQWTKNCLVGPNSIKLETAAKSLVDMSRSGQNGLQGRFVPAGPVAGSGAGMSGSQVHLSRVE